MLRAPAICGHCKSEYRIHALNTDLPATCPSCYGKGLAYVYPAWYQDRTVRIANDAIDDGDASCFFHEKRRAKAACDTCGKFICDTCKIDYAGDAHCPECIGNGKASGVGNQSSAKRYDRLTLLLSLLPYTLVFWFAGIVTVPLSLYLSVKHWSRRDTLVPYNRWRYVVSILLSLGAITIATVTIVQIIYSKKASAS